jgi:hypothetical protein
LIASHMALASGGPSGLLLGGAANATEDTSGEASTAIVHAPREGSGTWHHKEEGHSEGWRWQGAS